MKVWWEKINILRKVIFIILNEGNALFYLFRNFLSFLHDQTRFHEDKKVNLFFE